MKSFMVVYKTYWTLPETDFIPIWISDAEESYDAVVTPGCQHATSQHHKHYVAQPFCWRRSRIIWSRANRTPNLRSIQLIHKGLENNFMVICIYWRGWGKVCADQVSVLFLFHNDRFVQTLRISWGKKRSPVRHMDSDENFLCNRISRMKKSNLA